MSSLVNPPPSGSDRSPQKPLTSTKGLMVEEAELPPDEQPSAQDSSADNMKFWTAARSDPLLQGFQMWLAPFPPPQAVFEYERILPGTWERLLRMAEEAQAADISNLRNNEEYQRRDVKRGQLLGVVAMFAAMAGAIYCVKLNQPWVAAAFLSMTVMAVARSFIESIRSFGIASKTESTVASKSNT